MKTVCLMLFILPVLAASGCEDKRPPPVPAEPEPTPPRPTVDKAFLEKAFGPGTVLTSKAVVVDIDRRPGIEALVAIKYQGRNYEVAVVRGNHQVLARAPLGGKILSNANIQATADFKRMDLWVDGSKTYLMPVETLVYHQSVCGVVAFRYRYNSLSVVGEFATKCWRKEAMGHGGDPFKHLKVIRDDAGQLIRVESLDERGPRIYFWDKSKQAFISRTKAALPPKK